ncbi:D-alanine--poly(phosphoribitol) ligase, subunit 2 [Pseudoramibacter alactolyticus ATCC 23263]|jgi:D-alanine--poly(phosphoribitol) ligase subunit 2|uniref:D-alanyl carrier protein n=1 Tax=Pseudoramibacter alactolyticus ATCC 23263 TaxID=887929 RepID=E6MFK1_9FIRM|nr:D-alanine--poly(phosphoribitol) ligase subunit DltC [Pseudoramibacter alactolyticus]EFV02118.1 D-alanine--poly(phosphoribitol) ligase, subunit 2 [Pseudoramibacter alactolyticus ATCC 23263]MBM6968065.1 D-alanine--poly(phosphoribitol) ligase subunit DltC [Pseudoramibacter alactolyticus]
MEEKILAILEELCGDEVVREDLDINLTEEDLLDSLDYAELLTEIESAFGIVISPSEVAREDMDTPNKIIAQVKKRLTQ